MNCLQYSHYFQHTESKFWSKKKVCSWIKIKTGQINMEVYNTKFSKQADTDNFLSLPLYSPLPQQVAIVPDGTTCKEAALAVITRNIRKEDWDESFAIGDLGVMLKQYKRWKKELPRVEVFYSVSANALPPVINTMAALGCGFNCASKNEMALVLKCRVKPEKIFCVHTCKMLSHLTYARDNDVTMMTFDNEEELLKIQKYFPSARLILLFKVGESQAETNYETKFGASFEYCKFLIKKARQLELDISGISCHVASDRSNLKSISTAIEESRMLFDFACEVGCSIKLLDIGGGFPGTEKENTAPALPFETIAAAISDGLDKHFPDGCGVRIIAELGRYITGTAFGLVTNITAKKVAEDRVVYHIADTIYNSFSPDCPDAVKLAPVPLKSEESDIHPTTIYGVSCSGWDIVCKETLAKEANVGEWLYWKDHGGGAALVRFGFNGYSMYKGCYIITKSDWSLGNIALLGELFAILSIFREELQAASTYPSMLPNTRDFI